MTYDREAAYIRSVWQGLYSDAIERGDEAAAKRCQYQIARLDERLRENEDNAWRTDLPNSAVWACAFCWGGAWLMMLGASWLLAFSLFSLFSRVGVV